MIVSHKHKFIFIKPQKTAGTSIELLLSRICGPEDIITPLGFDPDPNVRKKHQARPPQNYQRAKPVKSWELREMYRYLRTFKKPNLDYWEHIDAQTLKAYLGEGIWNDYQKISIVRNPWDHAISMYQWMAHYNYEGVKGIDLRTFLLNHYKLMWPFYSVKNIYQIDFMIRFEQLQEDIEELGDRLPLNDMALPQTKTKVRKNKNYAEFFDEETKTLVEEMNDDILKRFDYKFSEKDQKIGDFISEKTK